jgi:excisionase family DNA binding protein
VIPHPSVRSWLSAEEAFAELGIDRTTGYRAIREGTFPVPVIRVGRLIRVPTAALRRLLDPDDARAENSYPDGPAAEDLDAAARTRRVARPEMAHQHTSTATQSEAPGGHR